MDTENNLSIILLQKMGLSYEIHITSADMADMANHTWTVLRKANRNLAEAFTKGKTGMSDNAGKLLRKAKRAFDKGKYGKAENIARQAIKVISKK